MTLELLATDRPQPAGNTRAALSAGLSASAAGDLEAFLGFYDATCATAYRLELCRLRDPEPAGDATCERYLNAWLRAGEQATSGLSPLAWLLSLSPGPARAQPGEEPAGGETHG